jgi:predicted O-linked N-acetylglucosamine transferase (SPINDLY family)
MDCWSEIMKVLPNARIVLKSRAFNDMATCERFLEMFDRRGISPGRVKTTGYMPLFAKHLSLYHEIDIALDTFPYNGTTTTCEALWMGIPVVVLAGNSHASRVGVSLLSQIGIAELISETTETYVDKAIDLARDLERLQNLRKELRTRVSRSPLTDAQRFVGSLEKAYRLIWKRWCKNPEGTSMKSCTPNAAATACSSDQAKSLED